MTAADGGAALASSQVLLGLGAFLSAMTTASRESGWRAPAMVIGLGEGEEEILVGVRWLASSEQYAAEIR